MDRISVWILRGMMLWIVCVGVYFETRSPIFGQGLTEFRLDDHERRIVALEAKDIAVLAEKVHKLEWMNGTALAAILVQLAGQMSDKARSRQTPRRRHTD